MTSSNSGEISTVPAPPAVTVLMGVYNSAAHVEGCIQSILNQTFADFEFLIVDDGSKDDTFRVIERYAAADPRIRFRRNETNLGLGEVLRRGVLEARAALIARIDADDTAMPHRLERQVSFLREHPDVDVVGSYALDVNKSGAVLRDRRVPTSHEKIVELVWTNPFIHPTVMFRKESILRVGSYSSRDRRRQDYDLWFRCVAGGLRLANIPEPLVRYLFTEDTMKRNHIGPMWDQTKIGLRGCRLVKAPAFAYVATCMPLIESLLPSWLRIRVQSLKAKVDPRRDE